MFGMKGIWYSAVSRKPRFSEGVFFIVLVQSAIVNAAMIPLDTFGWISRMFSCIPFGIAGWIAVILLAATMVPADLVRKWVFRPVSHEGRVLTAGVRRRKHSR